MEYRQFEQDKKYQAALSIARDMLKKGMITADDYRTIETRLASKYHPVFGAITQ